MASPHRIPFRTFLWEYLGYPDDEPLERRRILYAIVALRLGFGLLFLLRGWHAVFAAPPDAVMVRLGDPARLGLSGATVDTTLFLLACSELGVGALLLFGAFSRVSAASGLALTLSYLLLGDRKLFSTDRPTGPDSFGALVRQFGEVGDVLTTASLLALVGGLVLLVICGSPFMGAERAVDKLEEEERDRPPARLPHSATATPLLLRLGLAAGWWWFVLLWYGQLPGRSPLLLALALAISVPLLLGLGTRLLALPFALLLLPLLGGGPATWQALEWTTPAIPTVALALIIAGPGTASLDHWLRQRQVAPVLRPELRGDH